MIYLDTNCFIRLFSEPANAEDRRKLLAVANLMREARNNTKTYTTTDAVLAEVVYVLTSPAQTNMSRRDVTARLRSVLSLKGCRAPQKKIWLRTLTIWESTPSLSFVDSLIAATVEGTSLELGSFDQRLLRHPGVTPYSF